MGQALVEGGHHSDLLDLAEQNGISLRQLLVTGSADQLRPTDAAQPALYFTGVALAEILLEGGLEPFAAAGHSLGEYCAVVASGALSPADGMRLVLERGRLMASAREGTMAAVLGLELSQLAELCLEAESGGECCVVANDNAPGQVVVSGTVAGVARLTQLAEAAGARRVIPLNVGGAFHSPLMAAAGEAFAIQLDQVEIREPRFPVGAGVSGTLSRSAAEIRAGLRDQLTGPVRWVDTVRALSEVGVAIFFECGPGSTLAGLGKRILPRARTISVDSPDHAELALSQSSAGEDGPASGGDD